VTDDKRDKNGFAPSDQPLVLEDEEGLFSNLDEHDEQEDADRVQPPPPAAPSQEPLRDESSDSPPRETTDSQYPIDSDSDDLDFEREFYAQFEKETSKKDAVETEAIDEIRLTPIDEEGKREVASGTRGEVPESPSDTSAERPGAVGIVSRFLSSTPPPVPEQKPIQRAEPSDSSQAEAIRTDDSEPPKPSFEKEELKLDGIEESDLGDAADFAEELVEKLSDDLSDLEPPSEPQEPIEELKLDGIEESDLGDAADFAEELVEKLSNDLSDLAPPSEPQEPIEELELDDIEESDFGNAADFAETPVEKLSSDLSDLAPPSEPQEPIEELKLDDIEESDFGDAADFAEAPVEKLSSDLSELEPAPEPQEPALDEGAIAARRTIHRRAKPRDFHPLTGSNPESLRERGAFLANLAQRSTGPQKARLLVAAAEINQRVGEADQAIALYQLALEADHTNLVAIRAVRRDACSSGDWEKAAELLRSEAQLALTPQERGLVLTLLAEILFRQLDDSEGAQREAEAALAAFPAAIPAGLLLAETHFSSGRDTDGIDALQRVAAIWQDEQLREALRVESAHVLERAGEIDRAAQLFRQAVEIDPRSMTAMANVVRTSRATGDFDTSINTLLKMSELFETGAIRDALVRIAARYALYLKKSPEQALELLSNDQSVLGIRTRRLAAAQSENRETERLAVEALTEMSSGSERALAFVELAQHRLDAGDSERALTALQEATLADNRIGAIRVLREAIARKRRDPKGLVSAIEEEDTSNALTAAAKLVRSSDETTHERWLLELAHQHPEGSIVAETIGLDAAAEAGDRDWIRLALHREVARADKDEQIGPLFSLLFLGLERQSGAQESASRDDLASRFEQPRSFAPLTPDAGEDDFDDDFEMGEDAVELVEETIEQGMDDDAFEERLEAIEQESETVGEPSADESDAKDASVSEHLEKRSTTVGERITDILERLDSLLPNSPIVLRQLARASSDSEKAADCFLRESAGAQGAASAYAATVAGRYLQAAQRDPMPAYRQAIDCVPGYGPACWAIESRARAIGDNASLAFIHEQLAQYADCSQERVSRYVRAALLRSADDREIAVELLRSALEIHPQDSVINDLILRLLGKDAATEIAERLLASASDESPKIVRSARLRAATAFENVGELENAAELYRQVIESAQTSEPLARFALERLEVVSGHHDRVRERLAAALQQAPDDRERAARLHQLIEFESDYGDESNAFMHLNALLEIEPGDIPALRMLERHYMEKNNTDEALRITDVLTQQLSDPTDIGAYLRQLVRLKQMQPDAAPDCADQLFLQYADRAVPDLWLTQKLEGAARATGNKERIGQALSDSIMHYADSMERASIALRAAEETSDELLDELIEKLSQAVAEAPEHPTAAEELAWLYERFGNFIQAAQTYEEAARHAHNKEREARLWRQAAVLWQDQIADNDRGMAALIRARDADVMYGDVFLRLKTLFKARGESNELAKLLQIRIERGGDNTALAELNLELSNIYFELGDHENAKVRLTAALDLDPQHGPALRRLADMHLDDHEWREASEVLIRLARLTKDNDELCWLFSKLGDIYQKHLPDLQRAEIAFTRIIKLQPENVEAIERLVDIFQSQQMHAKAARALQRLVQLTDDPDRKIKSQLRFAGALAKLGQHREAEETLESCRKQSPTNIEVINALSDFYRRQGAHNALSMHLNRTSAEFRSALTEDPTKVGNWRGLVDVLVMREQTQSAQSCASTAVALGVSDPKLDALLRDGSATPFIKALTDREIDRVIAPARLTDSVRFVFGGTAFALDRVAPFDTKAYGVERLRKKSEELERVLNSVCQDFGISGVALCTSTNRVCMPISNDPLTVLIGEALLDGTDPAEKRFLLTRAIKLAVNNLSFLVRTPIDHLTYTINALIRHFDSDFEPAGVDLGRLDETARQIGKFIPRKYHDELAQNIFEIKGMTDFDPVALPSLVNEFGSRAALVATGSSPAAIRALLKIDKILYNAQSSEMMLTAINQCREARALFAFALSDTYLDARQLASELDRD
jgi:tetratricopeptide (TPR) repeat protein